MARRRRFKPRGQSNTAKWHIQIYRHVFEAPAYRHLSTDARALLDEVWMRHNGVNNGEIGMSVRDAARRINVGKDRASRAFDELIEHQFLVVRAESSFHQKNRMSREFEITTEGVDGGSPSFVFRNWKPK